MHIGSVTSIDELLFGPLTSGHMLRLLVLLFPSNSFYYGEEQGKGADAPLRRQEEEEEEDDEDKGLGISECKRA